MNKKRKTAPPRKRVRANRAKSGLKTPLARSNTDYVSIRCTRHERDALIRAIKQDPADPRISNNSGIGAYIERCEYEASVYLSVHLDQTDGRLVEETSSQVRASLLQLQAALSQNPLNAEQLTEIVSGVDARTRSLLRKYARGVNLDAFTDAYWNAHAATLKTGVAKALKAVPVKHDGRPKNEPLYTLAAAIRLALYEVGIKPTTYPQGPFVKIMEMVRQMAVRHANQNGIAVSLTAIPHDVRNLLQQPPRSS